MKTSYNPPLLHFNADSPPRNTHSRLQICYTTRMCQRASGASAPGPLHSHSSGQHYGLSGLVEQKGLVIQSHLLSHVFPLLSHHFTLHFIAEVTGA